MNELSNHFGNGLESATPSAMAISQEAKGVQEIQAALVIAKKFPRNQHQAFEDIMQACTRPMLAENAMYAYPKGGSLVTGPSIRLAEVLAQNWGNMVFGIRELSQNNGVSEVEAYAWDLQTNCQTNKIFHVPHVRHTKKGSYTLTDQREIYELVANQGSRRLRACILGVIPGDIVDAAVEKCGKTLSSGQLPISERIKAMIVKFNELGVKVENIEKRLGHKMDAIIEPELITLTGIYKSMRDGMSVREDWFDFDGAIEQAEQKSGIKDLINNKTKPKVQEVVNIETGEIRP